MNTSHKHPRTCIALGFLVSLLMNIAGCGDDGPSGSNAVVPAVVGLTEAAATSEITSAGLVVGPVARQPSSTAPSGTVISASPAAGSSLSPGTTVTLVVSTGPALVTVPNVAGMSQATATNAIVGAGLTLGVVDTQASDVVALGNVISESPAAGTSVLPGSAVSLVISNPCQPGGSPAVTLDTPTLGASQLSGVACNVDPSKTKVVIYVLTNQWYVQPLVIAPFTSISANGRWSNSTNPWNRIVILLVDPATYVPAATKITNPALDAGVLAWAQYPSTGPTSLQFSGHTWGIKVSGDPFDPGPNYWSNDPSVVSVAADGLHLRIVKIDGKWQCAEVYLLESLGYGIYTVQVSSRVDQLGRNTVAAPLFTYAAINQELDFEYGGAGGLIPGPYNAQFVVQPYTVPGNLARYVQPSTDQFTVQLEWRADHVTFRSWNGWAATPAGTDIISQWAYTGTNIPPPGQERIHINLWLLNGNAPVNGIGDEMVIRSFTYQP